MPNVGGPTVDRYVKRVGNFIFIFTGLIRLGYEKRRNMVDDA